MVLAVETRTVGEVLRAARRAQRWSLITLEQKTDEAGLRVAATTIRGIENGAQQPTPRSLQGLAAALKLDYDDLMRLAGYLPGQHDEPEGLSSLPADVRNLTARLAALRPRARQRIVRVVDHLVDQIEAILEEEGEEGPGSGGSAPDAPEQGDG